MALPAFVSATVTSWATFYDAHKAVSVAVRYLHLAGILVGGGSALAADRQILRARRGSEAEKSATLASLGAVHRIVVPALAVIVVSGILMTAADAETFLRSRLYWGKLALVALLLLNGTGLLAAERAATRDPGSGGWRRLAIVSAVSLLLWLAIPYVALWLAVSA
jgi:hypothetical protein